MSRIHDISVNISNKLPLWPGAPEPRFQQRMSIDSGDVATDSNLFMNLHTGTHVDAPSHFIREGNTVDMISMDNLVGKCTVIEIDTHIKEIDQQVLDRYCRPDSASRLLLKTCNSEFWEKHESVFQSDFAALTAGGARWVVERGFSVVGIDYLSIQRYRDGPETHQILLKNQVVVIEGLNLANVDPGEYELFCLPLKLKGLEAAPARVILREYS